MNKNIVYDDDQDGGKMLDSHLSVTDKRGMGNYVVLDWLCHILQPLLTSFGYDLTV